MTGKGGPLEQTPSNEKDCNFLVREGDNSRKIEVMFLKRQNHVQFKFSERTVTPSIG